jgi:transposase
MPKSIRQKLTKTTQKLRDDICHEYYAKGERIADISRKHAIAISTVSEIVKRYKIEGTTGYNTGKKS